MKDLQKQGPLMAARAATEADGRWPVLRSQLRELHEGLTSADYLLVVGGKEARRGHTRKTEPEPAAPNAQRRTVETE